MSTGIYKLPVPEGCEAEVSGLRGDVRVEPRKLGELDQALSAYPWEHYPIWEAQLGRDPFVPGQFGENLTLEGLPESEARIGDILEVGGAVLQVSQPRLPCRKLDAKMEVKFAPTFLRSRHVGYYLRVLRPGWIAPGDRVAFAERAMSSPTVDEFVRISQFEYWDVAGLEDLLRARDLSSGWQDVLRSKLDRARAAKGWFGMRALEVVSRVRECENVVSIGLACARGRPLPPHRAGEFITISVRTPSGAVVRRAYVLSGNPYDPTRYRLTVKHGLTRPPDEVASSVSEHLARSLPVGGIVNASAPQGFWTLEAIPNDCNRIVFVNDGIGIAPVPGMIRECARRFPDIPVDVFHSDECRQQHALRAELEELRAETAALRLHVAYRTPPANDGPGSELAVAGCFDGDRILESLPPSSPVFFLSGSSDYVRGTRTELEQRGIPRARMWADPWGAI